MEGGTPDSFETLISNLDRTMHGKPPILVAAHRSSDKSLAAAQRGYPTKCLGVMRMLLERSANVDACSLHDGETVLHRAAVSNNLPLVVELLDQYGADIEGGVTPLTTDDFDTGVEKHASTTVGIVQVGNNKEAVPPAEVSPLYSAACMRRTGVVRELAKRGANLCGLGKHRHPRLRDERVRHALFAGVSTSPRASFSIRQYPVSVEDVNGRQHHAIGAAAINLAFFSTAGGAEIATNSTVVAMIKLGAPAVGVRLAVEHEGLSSIAKVRSLRVCGLVFSSCFPAITYFFIGFC